MSSIELKSRAKINLSLDVIGKRPDGYHEVRMIMQTIELFDRVFMDVTDCGIEVTSDCRWVPSGSDNIAYKAAMLLKEKFSIHQGIRIKIEKRIPVAAGLAGGSSNAAAVLKGMNHLFALGLSEDELAALGKQIGADVPYCIRGGTMLAEGIGEVLTGLASFDNVPIVLVKPKIGVSTAWVYKSLELDKIMDRPDTDKLITAIREGSTDTLAREMKNVLETVTVKKYSVISEIKNKLLELGALGSMMSGSGPSVFGVFGDKETAQRAYNGLKSDRWDVFLTRTISGGK